MDFRSFIVVKPVYRSIGAGWWRHVGWHSNGMLPLARAADGKLATQLLLSEVGSVSGDTALGSGETLADRRHSRRRSK